jgi:leucyl/phenylalanyl-tRNA--protein transferase
MRFLRGRPPVGGRYKRGMRAKRGIPVLDDRLVFPDPRKAGPEGLLAIGGDFSPERLLAAYRAGIFPWSADPITWWSPNPRAVLPLDGIHVSRRLARTLRQNRFQVTFDTAFEEVMRACAAPAPGREETWITEPFLGAYTELHRLGYAHSIEVWLDGLLAGGLYGLAVGAFFSGESMFHHATDASKVALVRMTEHLRRRGFLLFDSQVATDHTESMGVIDISRDEYLVRLGKAVRQPVSFSEKEGRA